MMAPRPPGPNTVMGCKCGWKGKCSEADARPNNVVRCPQCGQPVVVLTLNGEQGTSPGYLTKE